MDFVNKFTFLRKSKVIIQLIDVTRLCVMDHIQYICLPPITYH